MIYFAQIVMLRLRKISPNCAQIVLEKKKHDTFFTRKVEFLFENHYLAKNRLNKVTKTQG